MRRRSWSRDPSCSPIGLLSNSQSWKSGLHDAPSRRRPGSHPGRRLRPLPRVRRPGRRPGPADRRRPDRGRHPTAERARAHRGTLRLADHGDPGVRRAARGGVRRGPARGRDVHPGARRAQPRPRPGAAPPPRRRRRDRPQLRGALRPARHRPRVRRRGRRPPGVPRRARLLPGRAAEPAGSDRGVVRRARAADLARPDHGDAGRADGGVDRGAGVLGRRRPGARGDADLPQRDRRAAARGRASGAEPGRPRWLGPRRRGCDPAPDVAAARLPDPRLPEPHRPPDDRRAAGDVRRAPASRAHGRRGRRGPPGAGARRAGDAAAVRVVRTRDDHDRQRQQVLLGRPATGLDPGAARPDGAPHPGPGQHRPRRSGARAAGPDAAARRRRRDPGGQPRRACVEQRDALVGAVTEQLPEWSFHRPTGGLALWCQLPGAFGTALVTEAERRGVIIAPGPVFAAEGGLDRFVRIPWTRPADELAEAVRRVADAWAIVQSQPTSSRRTARVMVA